MPLFVVAEFSYDYRALAGAFSNWDFNNDYDTRCGSMHRTEGIFQIIMTTFTAMSSSVQVSFRNKVLKAASSQ